MLSLLNFSSILYNKNNPTILHVSALSLLPIVTWNSPFPSFFIQESNDLRVWKIGSSSFCLISTYLCAKVRASFSSFSVIDEQNSWMSKTVKVYKLFCWMFLKQSITSLEFWRRFNFNLDLNVLLIFCNIYLLILPSWLFVGFSRRYFGLVL